MLVSLGLPARFATFLKASLRIETRLKRENSHESEQSFLTPPPPGGPANNDIPSSLLSGVTDIRESFRFNIHKQILASAKALLLRVS